MKKYIPLVLLLPVFTRSFAQDRISTNSRNYLSAYIDTGINNNLVLKDKNVSLEQSLLALKNAKSYFLPSVAFNADYLSAEGGRIISLPTGELLNPVYSTLNQLTSSQKFPSIGNENAQLLPNDFYDARFHITYPLLNADLYYNRKISQQAVVLQQYEVDIYRQDLIRDIKQAYFDYCSATVAISIYKEALVLVDRNLKETQSLLDNGRGLPANVLRVESEQQNIDAKIIESDNGRLNARNYLNFLINRPLMDSVNFEDPPVSDSLTARLSEIPDVQERGELKKINAGIDLYNTRLKLNQSYYLPKLNTFLDLGSQASDFKFNSGSRYYYFGAQLSIPVFAGGRNRNNIRQAQLDLVSLNLEKDELTHQLEMAATMAQNNVASAWAACKATEKQLAAARAYFNLIDKGFKEGANSLLDFLDARNQLTTSALQLNINQYKVLHQLAEYERQTVVSKIK
jgi:outer membrane protein